MKLVKTGKVLGKEIEQEQLTRHFADRIVAKESQFQLHQKKLVGISEGYIAVKRKTPAGIPSMIKIATKVDTSTRNETCDTMCFVNEFVSATLYKRTLYDRTPIIDGVVIDHPQRIALRSKFLNDFQTLAHFTGSLNDTQIGWDVTKLQNVGGIEKVFAAMLVWAERDMHAGNIGVMDMHDTEKGTSQYVLSKIDHGFSAVQFFTDPGAVLENFAIAYEQYRYDKGLPLNIIKFKLALEQIVAVSDEEIATLIRARIFKLKQMGFEVKNLQIQFWENDVKHVWDETEGKTESLEKTSTNSQESSAEQSQKKQTKQNQTFMSFQELENYYINHYKQQLIVMREVCNRLDIISKITPVDDNWQNGQWLIDIGGLDPI